MKKIILLLTLILSFSAISFSQPRSVEKSTKQPSVTKTTAPISFTAKYEGGMFGFDNKQEGTLKFDDENERFVFFGKDQKEKFSIPYKAMNVVYIGTKSVRSGAGTAVSVIPLPGAGLAGLIREKRHYLVIQYSDPDVEVRGVVNFKLENQQMRESVVQTLGIKAKLTQRGDAFYRQKSAPTTEL
ncbi:MAG: hypothetical protein M3388_16105 [Acidobacteriota bacterium]|nr:hypothetical protein [Acidobacteriota bacterium]